MAETKFTREDCAKIEKVHGEIRRIIANSSASRISIELREVLAEMYPKLGFGSNICLNCPSGLNQALNSVNGQYHHDKYYYDKLDEENNNKQEKTIITNESGKSKKPTITSTARSKK